MEGVKYKAFVRAFLFPLVGQVLVDLIFSVILMKAKFPLGILFFLFTSGITAFYIFWKFLPLYRSKLEITSDNKIVVSRKRFLKESTEICADQVDSVKISNSWIFNEFYGTVKLNVQGQTVIFNYVFYPWDFVKVIKENFGESVLVVE